MCFESTMLVQYLILLYCVRFLNIYTIYIISCYCYSLLYDLILYYLILSCLIVRRIIRIIQVVPGRAGGGSFRRKKNYIAKKEFAYRMCDRPARCPNHFFAVNEPSAVPWW